MSRSPRVPVHARLPIPLCLVVALAAVAPSSAQITATLSPLTSVLMSGWQGGTRIDYCPGGFPLEWEVMFENDTLNADVVSFANDVDDGQNGGFFVLQCPPTWLPPAAVLTECDPATGRIAVDNIVLPPCARVTVRYNTDVTGGSRMDMCDGGDWFRAFRSRTVSPVDTPRPIPMPPSPRTDTCIFSNPMCNLSDNNDIRLRHWITDVNGPPLLPGDVIRVRAALDLSHMTLVPEIQFKNFFADALGPAGPDAIPANIDFLAFVDEPLAPEATYTYTPRPTHTIVVEDPDRSTPLNLPSGTLVDIVTWEGMIRCDSPPGELHCFKGILNQRFGFVESDDPATRGDTADDSCVMTALPDFQGSSKTVSDADRSGDAQPGEVLTFTVTIDNSTPCEAHMMDCECAAFDVQVLDTIDTATLDFTSISVFGATPTMTPPDQLDLVVDGVGPAGGTPNPVAVLIEARVRPDVTDSDQICNSVVINSPERLNVADGGLLENCPSFPPVVIDMGQCMDVVVPPTCLVLEKRVLNPGPYAIFDTVQYEIVATNCGTVPLDDLDVWDCLDATWDPAAITVLGAGGVNQPPAPPGCSGDWIRWDTLPGLAPGAHQTLRFDAVLGTCLDDGHTVENWATATAQQVSGTRQSPVVDIEVCAPSLTLAKAVTSTQPEYGEGDTIEWTLTVDNTGGCDATGVQVLDTFPAELSIVSATLPAGCIAATANDLVCDLTAVAVAAPVDLVIETVVGPVASDITVCNEAAAAAAECPSAVVTSTPAGGVCVDLIAVSCLPMGSIPDLKAVKDPPAAGLDVKMVWSPEPNAVDGHRVYSVEQKRDLTTVPGPPAATVCDVPPGPMPTCLDPGVVPAPPSLKLYQVRGLCDTSVGP